MWWSWKLRSFIVSGSCFFGKNLEVSVRKKVGRRAETIGEGELEWPAPEQGHRSRPWSPVGLRGVSRGQALKVLEQLAEKRHRSRSFGVLTGAGQLT